jgi:hypothetical protein
MELNVLFSIKDWSSTNYFQTQLKILERSGLKHCIMLETPLDTNVRECHSPVGNFSVQNLVTETYIQQSQSGAPCQKPEHDKTNKLLSGDSFVV